MIKTFMFVFSCTKTSKTNMKVFIIVALMAVVSAQGPYKPSSNSVAPYKSEYPSYKPGYPAPAYKPAYPTPSYKPDFPAPKPEYPAPSYKSEYPSPAYKPAYPSKSYDYPPMPYKFEWAVKDDYTYNDYAHEETSDDKGQVTGSYRTLLPDGRTQVVNYKADDYTGYIADVKYEGEAKYPTEYKPAYKPAYPEPAYKPAYSEQGYKPAYPQPAYPAPAYKPAYPTAKYPAYPAPIYPARY
uniref:Cuticle protein n=2 Tax=Daphnia magna TaxID=35525 RepID=A0A0P4ZUM5_9CRUS